MKVSPVLLLVAGLISWRLLPTVRAASPLIVTVTSTADAGQGSLRAALEAVNAAGDGDIDLGSLTGLIALETSLPEVRAHLRLIGPEESAGRLLISGQGKVPILSFAAGTTSEVSHLTLTNALATGYRHGAAISNAGVLVLRDCEIRRWAGSSPMAWQDRAPVPAWAERSSCETARHDWTTAFFPPTASGAAWAVREPVKAAAVTAAQS